MSLYLESEHLYLREVRQSDVTQRYVDWLNDRSVNRFLETRFVPHSLDTVAAFVASKAGDRNEPFFAICVKGTDQHIGNAKIGPIDWIHRRASTSILIGESSAWGKGYATEVFSMLSDHAFRELNLNKLEAGVYSQNEGSLRMLERNGFVREGVIRQHCWLDGEYVDVVKMGLLAQDWWRAHRAEQESE